MGGIEEHKPFACTICGKQVVWIDFKTVGNGPKGQWEHERGHCGSN